MSFLGLFLECDYSYYVFFVENRYAEIDIRLYGKYKKDVSDFKIYFRRININ